MAVISIPDFDALPVVEKIRLVQQLWSRIAERPDDVPVSDETKQELDRRLAGHEREPERATSWDDAVKRIRSK